MFPNRLEPTARERGAWRAQGRASQKEDSPMTTERIWLLVNKRRTQRGKEPIPLSRIQRIVRAMWPRAEQRRPPVFKAYNKTPPPFTRWDIPAPRDGRPAFKSDNRR